MSRYSDNQFAANRNVSRVIIVDVLKTDTMRTISILILTIILFPSFYPVFGQMESSRVLYEGQILDLQSPVSKIAFGSCNNQRKQAEQSIWADVVRNRPDLWLWTGDIIYGDTEDMNLMREYYIQQKS